MAEPNYTPNTVYPGENDDDLTNLTNYASGVTIKGDTTDNFITNTNDGEIYGTSVSINAGGGADTVDNSEQNVTILGGAGDDSISNSGSNVTIDGGTNKDTISSQGDNISISAGAGDDSVVIAADSFNIEILGGADNDTIENSGGSVIIDAGDGADEIQNYGSEVTINGGKGKDEIQNYGSEVTIDGGSDADEIYNNGETVSITGGAGNDSISNDGDNVTIGGGDGADSIYNDGANVTFQYTSGNDVITGFNATSTLQLMSGGITSASLSIDNEDAVFKIGNNTLTLKNFGDATNKINLLTADGVKDYFIPVYKGTAKADDINISDYSNISIKALGGDDNISNSGEAVSINGGDGNDYISNNGLSAVIYGGTGNDTVDNIEDYAKIYGNDGNDTITNSGVSSIIDGGNGADLIENNGTAVSITGGDGNDSITNDGSNVTISGGAGKDSISNSGFNATIDAGAGDDTITNSGDNVTISSGAGNDTVENNNGANVTFQYTSGNDVITGFNDTSILQLMSGSITSPSSLTATADGFDGILKIGTGILTIKNLNETNKINLIESDGTATEHFISLYQGTKGADNINISDYSNISIKALVGDDTISNSGESVTIEGGTGNDSITNSGNSAIIDGGENNDEISNEGAAVSITGGVGDDSISNSGNSATIGGGAGDDTITNSGENVTFQYTSGNDVITGFDETSTLQIMNATSTPPAYFDGTDAFFTNGNSTLTVEGFGDTNKINLQIGDGKVEKYSIPLYQGKDDEDDSFTNSAYSNISIRGLGGNDNLENLVASVTIEGGAGDDYITNGADGLNAVIYGGDSADTIDNEANYTKIYGDADNDSIKNSGASSTIEGGTGDDYIENSGENVLINGGGGSDTIDNAADFAQIFGGDGDDSIYNNGGESVFINGGAGDDLISNSGNSATIGGGAGDDTITNSGENVTFQYTSGNDVITGFDETSVLQIMNATSTPPAYFDGTDAFFITKNGTLTVEGFGDTNKINLQIGDGKVEKYSIPLYQGKDDEDDSFTNSAYSNISIRGLGGNDNLENLVASVTIEGGDGDDYITNGADGLNAVIYGGDSSDTVDNAADFAQIFGGDGDDSIYNNGGESVFINGGAGDDSISNSGNFATIGGGADNDYIENNNGANVTFQYSGGSDTIQGFNETSVLQFVDTSLTSAYMDGTDAFFITKNGTLTVKDFNETNKINLIRGNGEVEESLIPLYQGKDDEDDYDFIPITDAYSGISISALGGDDIINSSGSNVTIDGGTGDDIIENHGISATIFGGNDNDSIFNDGSDVIIDGGTGDDSVTTDNGSNISISGGGGSNSIEILGGSGVTVNVGAGDDSISIGNGVESINIEGFGVNDFIQLSFAADSLEVFDGGFKAGELTIFGVSTASIIPIWEDVDGGKKYIETYSKGASLSADDPYSIIYNNGGQSSLFTISGIIDTVGITVDSKEKTISITSESALGSMSISTDNDEYKFLLENIPEPEENLEEGWFFESNGTTANYREAGGQSRGYRLNNDGTMVEYFPQIDATSLIELSGISLSDEQKDSRVSRTFGISAANFAGSAISLNSHTEDYDFELIEGDYSSKTFIGSASNDSILNNGSNIKFELGAGDDSIENSAPSVTINAGAGDDYVSVASDALSVAVSLGGGSDSVDNLADSVQIFGGDDNDSITSSGESSIIDGGAGDDAIESHGDNVLIYAGEGDDSVLAEGSNLIINLGKGADSLELSGASNPVLQYSAGDGNDVIINGSSDATISVSLESVSFGGYSSAENDIILKIDDGSITFNNVSGELISLNADGNNFILNNSATTSIVTGAGKDVIENKVSYVTINAGAGNDTVTLSPDENSGGNVFVYKAGDGNDVIYNFNDNDSIQVADDSSFTTDIINNDVIFRVGTGRIILKNAAANNRIISIINSVGDSLISDYTYTKYGKLANLNSDTIEISSGTTEYTASGFVSVIDASNTEEGIKIIGNEDYTNSIVGGYGNDTLEGSTLDDTLKGAKGKDVFIYSGGNDIIEDYTPDKDKIRVSGTSLTFENFTVDDEDNLTLNFGNNNSLTINNGAGIDKAINLNSVVNYYTEDGIFDQNKSTVSLTGSADSFSAKNYSNMVTIDGSKASLMEIVGNNKANFIVATSDGSTLTGGKGKDTLFGGEGADVFVYNKGDRKDTIYNFGDSDKISLGSGVEIDDAYMKNNDGVIEMGTGRITIKNISQLNDSQFMLTADGKDMLFNKGLLIDQENFVAMALESSDTEINLSDYDVSAFTGGDVMKRFTVNGTDSADSIVGGRKNDKIYGNDGMDTLVGGKGNDTLWGGAGNDTFIFHVGDGNDVIKDFDASLDKLLIYNKDESANVKFSKSKYNKGTLTLTIQGGGKITLENITNTSSTFSINDDEWGISGKKLVKK